MASGTNRSLRPLLPALRGERAPSFDHQRKRRRVVTACQPCRSRRIKVKRTAVHLVLPYLRYRAV